MTLICLTDSRDKGRGRPERIGKLNPLQGALSRLSADCGGTAEDLAQVSRLLTGFGFVSAELQRRPPDPGSAAFREGVRNFQDFHGLERLNGELTPEVVELLQLGRCSHLRFFALFRDGVADSQRQDLDSCCHWSRRRITYAFDQGTIDLRGTAESGEPEFIEVDAAARMWTESGVIELVKVTSAEDADVLVGWRHTDPHRYLFGEGAIAHADFPGVCGSVMAGALPIHFNDGYEWGLGSGFDVKTVALHEFGHILGLRDIANSKSVMYPCFPLGREGNARLSDEDTRDLKELYEGVGQ